MTFYVLGSSGFLGKKICKLLKKENKIEISSKSKKDSIFTKIFKINYRQEEWISNIKKDDTLFILSNLGSIKFYSKYKKKIFFFENCLENRLFKKLDNRVRIIFFSTDMVFSGGKKIFSDSSKRNPINNYGRSKKKIEDKLVKYFKNLIILRLPKIYSKNFKDNTIYSQILKASKARTKIKLFYNQKMHYMDIEDFLIIIKKILKNKKLKGSYNLSTKKISSRFEIAKEFLKNKNLNSKYLRPFDYRKIEFNLPYQIQMKTNLYKKIDYYPKK